VQDWIEKLDAGGGEGARLYTYEVLYMKAPDLADQLSQVFGGGGGGYSDEGGYDDGASIMPGLEPVEMRSTDTPAPDAAEGKARAQDSANRAAAANGGGDGISVGNSDDVSISAVEESNALLVRATPGQWESIRRTIERLDTMPLQVHIEAQIIEVKLTGDLKYGVDWYFRNLLPRNPRLREGGIIEAGDLDEIGGGFWNFVGGDTAAVVTLLDNVSDLRILSTPSVLVRNNAEATLDVGTKIPVNSTSFQPIDGGAGQDGTYTQVQYLDTGVILTVKPRISRDGTVFMEIDQEVSSPGRLAAGGNREVESRNLTTEAAIKSGETVLMAGLIRDESTRGSSGLPGLSRIPVIGALFGTQTDFSDRSEVIILVTPTVIRDPNEARRMTDEYGERFRALDPMRAAPPDADAR
jgi:general secretion pathway protein D